MAARRDRTHYLYIAVIVAVALGILVGFAAPGVAVELKPIGTGFVNLIKMMISPIIFCTIVLGVGSVRKAAKVGAVGGLALGYFLVMSTVALAIGLIVGNILEPGSGLHITEASKAARARPRRTVPASPCPTSCSASSPRRWCPPSPRARCCRRCWSRCWPGSRCRPWARAGEPVLRGIGHIQRLVFRILSMIMWAAPVGAFGAMAAVVGETGVDALKSLAIIMIGFYVTCALFVFVILGTLLRVVAGVNLLAAAQVPGTRVPADPVHLLLGVGAAAADREDGAPGRQQARRRHHRADRLLLQPRRHHDLPDHVLALHRRAPWATRSPSASRSRCCSS